MPWSEIGCFFWNDLRIPSDTEISILSFPKAALAIWIAKPNFYSLPSTEKEINTHSNHKDRSLTSIDNVLSPPDWFEKASRDLHAVF